jgi:hypothetical protein
VSALLQHCISVLFISFSGIVVENQFRSYKTLVLFLSPRQKNFIDEKNNGCCLPFLFYKQGFISQEIIKGVTNSVSLVKKSAKLPSIRNKDGSTIVLAYKESEGLMVTMAKNGKFIPVL